jgi:hypothetical protein
MKVLIWLVALAAMLACLASACGGDDEGGGSGAGIYEECVKDSDCGEGLFCWHNKYCSQPCDGDGDCPANKGYPGGCSGKDCRAGCANDADCVEDTCCGSFGSFAGCGSDSCH